MDDGIPVNYATFAHKEFWFELIETTSQTFSFAHADDEFAEVAGIEQCKGKRIEDQAGVEGN